MLEQNELAGLEDSVYQKQQDRLPVGLYKGDIGEEEQEQQTEEEKKEKTTTHRKA